MIRIKVLVFAFIFALLGSPIMAIASDISNALYFGTIIISNNSTANTNVATVANISTTNLIAGGYLNATANNTVMRNSSGANIPFQPGFTPTNPWWSMFVPTIGENAYLTYLLYTDNSFNGEIRYFPSATGMTSLNSASLELGDNFSIIQRGWFDTSIDFYNKLVDKPHAIRIVTDNVVDEQINVEVVGVDTDCLDFVRVNTDWVRIPDDPAFSFTDGAGNDEPFTFIAWVNLDDATTSSVLTKYLVAGNQLEWEFIFNGADQLEIRCSGPVGVNDIFTTSLAMTADQGNWHHYAATYDATEANTGFELYRDGVNITNVRGGGGAYVGMTGGTEVVNIGSTTTGTAIFMDGLMAEIKVYNAELTQPEIEADYNGEHQTTDLVAWWRLDEGNGLPLDSSGNGHDANQNLADWVDTFTERYSTETFASNVASGEYTIETTIEEEPSMALWANDVNIGVNMGAGILPVKILEEITLTAPAASVTFSNIGTNKDLWDTLAGVTSRHLVVMVNAASDDASNNMFLHLVFNGDTGNNYNYQRLFGQGAAVNPAAFTNSSNLQYGWIPGALSVDAFNGSILLIPHAFGVTNNKAALWWGGEMERIVSVYSGRWASNASVDSIQLDSNGDFIAGSTFTLGVVDERYLVEEETNAGADFSADFDNIPQDGHDLVVIGYSQSDQAAVEDEILHEINNDGGAAAYPVQELTGRAGADAASQPAGDEIGMTSGDNAGANEFGAFVATYSQYAEATNQVHFTSLTGYHESTGPTSEVRLMSGRWATVDAITRLELYPNAGGDFKAGSLFSLYRVPRYVIDRQELVAPAATITFNNIPQEYQALQLLVYARSDDAIPISDDVAITLNTDAGPATFDYQYLEGTGAGPPTAAISAASNVLLTITAAGEGANEFGGGVVTFPRYERTDGHKHFITISGTNENQVIIRSSRWEDTDAITRIDLDPVNGANFIAGSVFELVGIMPTMVLDITVDSEVKGIADGNISIPDTPANWTFVEAAAMPYMEYQEIYVDEVLQQDIVWSYGTTFYDRSYYGLDFDGDSGDITVADDVAIQNIFDGGGTIECWINPDSDGEGNTGRIFDKRAAGLGWRLLAAGDDGTDVLLQFSQEFDNTDGVWISTTGEVLLNSWNHVVLTYTATAGVAPIVYVNRAAIAMTESSTSVGTRGTDVALDLTIGNNSVDAATFDGTIDEVRLYTRILGQPEVTANYNGGIGNYVPDDTTDLDAWWHLELGTGATVTDSSGNGNDGVITTALWANGLVPLPPTETGTNPATPSFRTASADADIIGNMTAFTPISQAQAPGYTLGPVNPFITSTPNITGAFTDVPPVGTFPLAGVIAVIANATATPPQLPLLIIAIIVILAASLTTSYTLRKYGSGTLIIKAFVIIGIMGIFIALGDFGIDWWMTVVFAIIATALAMASRQQSWQ